MFVIVLACPSQKTMRMRVMLAANMAKKEMGTRLLFVGSSSQTEYMKSLLTNSPVYRRILTEPNCKTTAEMALLCPSYVPKSEAKIVIVTSANHEERAKYLFERSLHQHCEIVAIDRSGVKYANVEKRERKKMDHLYVLNSLFTMQRKEK